MLKTKKSFIIPALCLVTAGLLFNSCTNNNTGGTGGTGPGSVTIPVPNDTSSLAKIDHFIPESQIRAYKAAFATTNDSLSRVFPALLIPDAEAFNKPAILNILKDPNCVGLRIYHGVRTGGKQGQLRLIIVGVDSQGKDILISKGSTLAAQADGELGGDQNGQCPTCPASTNN